ncbi:MAG: hypothetical protein ACEQSK_13110 [Sphingomonadaceae bacterium]
MRMPIDLKDKIGVPGIFTPQRAAEYHWFIFEIMAYPPVSFGGTIGHLPADNYSGFWCGGCDGKKN